MIAPARRIDFRRAPEFACRDHHSVRKQPPLAQFFEQRLKLVSESHESAEKFVLQMAAVLGERPGGQEIDM